MGLKEKLQSAKAQVRTIRDDLDESSRLRHQRELDKLATQSARADAKAKEAETLAEAREKVHTANARQKKAEERAKESKHPPKPKVKGKPCTKPKSRFAITGVKWGDTPGRKAPRITPKRPKLRK